MSDLLVERAEPAAPTAPALELDDLQVVYRVRGIDRPVLRGVTFEIARGESYGLVGESGCGKTTAAFAAMRYLPRNGRVVGGGIRLDGRDLLAMSDADGAEAPLDDRLDGLPEPRLGAQPVDPRRRPDRGGVHARRDRRGRGARALARDVAEGADLRPGAGHAPLSAPALRRHAAARGGRDGARGRPDAADPRRADHRPRRDRRGRGARPRRRPPRRVRHERPVHQPQPRRDRADVRARGRAVRGPAGRGGRHARRVRRPAPPVHGGAPPVHPRAAASARTSSGSTRSPASCPSSGRSFPAASSPTAARSRRRSATRTSRRSTPSEAATRAAATSTTTRRSSRTRHRRTAARRPARRRASRP